MKKTEQKKLFVVRNTPIRRFWALCAESAQTRADPRRPAQTLGGSVRCTDAPPVRICNVYDIYELAEAENRAGKASDGPEHGPGTSWGGGNGDGGGGAPGTPEFRGCFSCGVAWTTTRRATARRNRAHIAACGIALALASAGRNRAAS